jgi:prepilin-type N-terminal cleavage/methylation domain-containing protein
MLSKRGGLEKGFTLIELMVVLFIIGILAAVAIPIMHGRMDSSKWSEGKAVAGSIRTAARTYCAQMGSSYSYPGTTLTQIGFVVNPGAPSGDLDGKYFTDECFSIVFNGYNDYLITVDATKSLSSDAPTAPRQMTLDSAGNFTEIP